MIKNQSRRSQIGYAVDRKKPKSLRTCFLYGCDGCYVAVRNYDGKELAYGHMLCVLRAEVNLMGYSVLDYPQEEAYAEMEHGFRD